MNNFLIFLLILLTIIILLILLIYKPNLISNTEMLPTKGFSRSHVNFSQKNFDNRSHYLNNNQNRRFNRFNHNRIIWPWKPYSSWQPLYYDYPNYYDYYDYYDYPNYPYYYDYAEHPNYFGCGKKCKDNSDCLKNCSKCIYNKCSK